MAPDIRASAWEVVELDGAAVSVPSAFRPFVEFSEAGDIVEGMAGCNLLGGTYHRQGQTLTFGPLRLTRRACEPALMQVEQRFTEVLAAVSRYSMADGMLLLFAGDRQVATLRPRPRVP